LSSTFNDDYNFYYYSIIECGSNYTAKLEGMFQDIDLSNECNLGKYIIRYMIEMSDE